MNWMYSCIEEAFTLWYPLMKVFTFVFTDPFVNGTPKLNKKCPMYIILYM